MNEKQFIIQLAVAKFNQQYNRSLDYSDFDAMSIPNNIYSNLAYEVFSVRMDDYVRLRMYLTFDNVDILPNYRLEVDNTTVIGALGDEVFVTFGTIDRYYRDSGLYKFQTMYKDETLWDILICENDEVLSLESDEMIILEDGA